MKVPFFIMLPLAVILFHACNKDDNSPDQAANFSDAYILQHKGKYCIEIPDAYELAHIIMAVRYQNSQYDYFIRKNTSYFIDVLEYFNPYNTSKIFTSFNYVETDFDHNYSFRTNSYRYELDGNFLISKGVYPEMWSPDLFTSLQDEIEDFALESDFMNFYSNHRDFYASQVSLYDSLIQVSQIWQWLEEQFTARYDCYKILISPLTEGSHNTKRFETNAYKETLMFVSGFHRETDSFDTMAVLLKTRLLFTEIDHNYVNPVTDRYKDELSGAMSNLSVWKSPNQINGLYDNAYSIFNEYMTWAVFDLYVLDQYPGHMFENIRGITVNKMENERGFIKFREFEDYLIELFNNRTGNEIEDLYPRVLQWIKDNN